MAELNELTINGSNYTFEDDVARELATAEASRAQAAEQSLQTAINNKVDKVTGKGLSTNDYTNAEKAKLAELENYDDTQVRQLIAQTNANFVNYYTKAETYTKAEVQQTVDAIKQFTYEVVQVLPTASASTMNKIYLVPAPKTEDKNVKEEYITIESSGVYSWEMLGTTSIDLSNYYTKGQTDSTISSALSSALANYTTTADLTTLLSQKQDVIQDLANIRSGAQAGSTAYQKPQGGIPSIDMSQEVQTSLEKANTALQEHQSLDAYAKNDGYYEGMGVGTADNLTGQTERTNDAMYRKSGGSEEVATGTATISNIKGQTVAWNQLVENGEEIKRATELPNFGELKYKTNTRISGHIYLLSCEVNAPNDAVFLLSMEGGMDTGFNGVGSNKRYSTIETAPQSEPAATLKGFFRIVNRSGLPIDLITVNAQIFDLTLIYGAGNAPSTVAQFEADYEKWFGKPLDYEAYDAGSLRCVQLDSLKTTGFNQYNNGQAKVIGGLQYQITGTYTTITLNDETITPDANGLFTPSTTGTLIVTGGGNDTCIHISGDRNGTYEPYEEHVASIPVTTLKGKLNGQGESVTIFPDGMRSAGTIADEIYTVGDKTYAVKKIGSVNLGSLTWELGARLFFLATLNDYKEGTNITVKQNCICSNYPTIPPINIYNRQYGISTAGVGIALKKVICYDDKYADAPTFKTAVSGVMFYYELATPLVYEVDDFALPKRYLVDGSGTEEQVQKANVQGIAAILTCIYGVDAVKILDKLPQNYISEKSMDNFLAQLNTVTGGTWTKTWNENTGEWDFSFTPNAQTDDINTDETI